MRRIILHTLLQVGTMRWAGCLLLIQAYIVTTGTATDPHKLRSGRAVFLEDEDANSFITRKLRYNSWDFEMFTQGNLERECYEEVCNYEEARECFEDDDKTKNFWKSYAHNGQGGSSGNSPALDIAGLVAGLVGGFVLLVMIGVLIMYCVRYRAKERARHGRPPVHLTSNTPLPEALPLNQPPLPDPTAPGLPSYEEALEASGTYDAPPPPYHRGSARSNQPS
ncbi:transmembrane gamma-carboxyglutamic acid protein 2-like isoform X2 [Bufo gargarizans]|uniref:transmembrane gamma-carboxyglutamic acid protein 2 isoform X2 n=1 Tax=Bufo gargarizans TaxID=30331 RepID=UPI001CF40AE7|nr:transmembrane gamma-carboxyglutamic acid protein 2 isoform X2 [Bufo gargarizans]XP_044137519.1 transmembrane gamma-carboxyglutamic acid protein 2-like isoform X2 [Bufo gargarizans]